MTIKNIADYLEREKYDILSLRNQNFKNETFPNFTLRPTGQEKIEISDVVFDGCSVTNGDCVIRKGVTMKNVTITNLSCSGPLHISSEVNMNNVKVSGVNKPSMVWVRKQADDSNIENIYGDSDIALDISEYSGEISITGLSAQTVKRNAEEHVVIEAGLIERVDWNGLGFSPLSYWKLMAKKVVAAKAQEGVFSLPPKTGRNYDRSMSELAVLRGKGFVS